MGLSLQVFDKFIPRLTDSNSKVSHILKFVNLFSDFIEVLVKLIFIRDDLFIKDTQSMFVHGNSVQFGSHQSFRILLSCSSVFYVAELLKRGSKIEVTPLQLHRYTVFDLCKNL